MKERIPQTPGGPLPEKEAKGLVHSLPEVGNSWPPSHALTQLKMFPGVWSLRKMVWLKYCGSSWQRPHYLFVQPEGRGGVGLFCGESGFDSAAAQTFIGLVL